MGKRILSLDFIRGLAIIGVIVNHAITYGIMLNEENARTLLPKSPLVIFAPLLIFGTWAGIFALITGLVNSYQIYLRMKKKEDIGVALQGCFINSTLVLIIHFIFLGLFNRVSESLTGNGFNHSLITGSIELQQISLPPIELFFRADALAMISASGYLTCLLLWIIWRKQGFQNTKRSIKIILEFGAIILAVSQPLWNLLYPIFISFLNKGGLYYIPALFLSFISGTMHCLLPYGGYVAFGIILGIYLAEQKSIQEIKNFAKKVGFSLIIISIILAIYHIFTVEGNLMSFFFKYKMIPPDLYLLNLGIMMLWFPWFFEKIDYCSDEKHAKIAEKTILIRRFGILSLTLFMLEPFWCTLWSFIFHTAFGSFSGEKDVVMTNFGLNLLFLIIVFGSWLIILKKWEKHKYKFSFEWIMVKIGSKFRKKPSERSDLTKILKDK
ncbi:hypothetical protein DSAG12_02285 [Promethearchaeum syntrophicum]|uniref:Acyltransferase family protein n=1 Tax=Promethearchaeum syntrophicum TaxID=2594042 RepID=A0A5B9DBU8_9ARCH|nr:hypothetical protein [Candidatus Prometheoarchaeum syntrophicum]QEE16455.1 hypothetical protein DSAG12_02285 [Candidatus Prometheoarchaeum syntrophicum]